MYRSQQRTRTFLIIAFLAIIGATAIPIWNILRQRDADISTPRTASVPTDAPMLASRDIIVDLRDDATPDDVQQLNAQFGLNLQFNSPQSKANQLYRSTLPAGADRDAILKKLAQDARVQSAEADFRITTPEINTPESSENSVSQSSIVPQTRRGVSWIPNDPRYNEQWNFRMVDAEAAWKRSHGKGVIVAVIDTGVSIEPSGKRAACRDFAETARVPGYNFVANNYDPYDDNGHGTHVAGTIAEATNNNEGVAGLAYEATIMPLKVLSASGSGTSADIADAIRFAADNDANIINMSLGSMVPSAVIHSAVRYAKNKGVLIVCAAGNGFGEPVGYPAAFAQCMAVSSVGPSREMAFYSSYGPQVALAAPGGDMSETPSAGILQNTIAREAPDEGGGDYYHFQGTSMASPHVAGVAALVMAQGIYDAARVRDIMQRSAIPAGEKLKFGTGILNAGNATAMASRFNRNAHFKNFGVFLLAILVFLATRGDSKSRARLALAFASGALLPDYAADVVGYNSLWNLASFSVLIPFVAFWEWETGHDSQVVGAFSAGMALCLILALAVDGLSPFTPSLFGNIALPWMIANAIGALIIALLACERGRSR